MRRTARGLAASALLALAVGCGPDDTTLAGPDAQPARPAQAAASRPVIFRFTEGFHFVIPEEEGCAGFDVQIDVVNKIVVQLFADRLVFHVNSVGTQTNLASGFVLTDNGNYTQTLRLDAEGNIENATVVGSVFHITVPGAGIVQLDAGIITYDPVTGEVFFEGGPHGDFHFGTDYCALLAAGSHP